MALIAMAVYSTDENKKDSCLEKTLYSLSSTVDLMKHSLYLSINSKTEQTENIIDNWLFHVSNGKFNFHIIRNETNIGTAEAINKVFALRQKGEHAIKIDDDVVIHSKDWIEVMEDAINRDPSIGIIGLKRKDCIEKVTHPDPYFRSNLIQLPQKPGERWIIAEEVHHVMGTCQMLSSALLDEIGYLYQPKLYGWDDVLASARSRAVGFKNVFLPHIEIDHIDDGATPYQSWKEKHAGEDLETITKLMEGYKNGTVPTYYNPFK